MSIFNPNEGFANPLASIPIDRSNGQVISSSTNVENIITQPKNGEYFRRQMRWRIPSLGWITMFMNPQSLKISDKKTVEGKRTKGGFAIQYGGEDLTQISLDGSTGSAGFEGINILYTIYRAEQFAFNNIAEELDRTGLISELIQMSRGTGGVKIGLNAESQSANASIIQNFSNAALNIFNQPFPTLASLASNIEMFYQGVVYRGYFNSFSVNEHADRPGLFDYSMSFTAYSKQGVRRNFMPWHRQPFNPIGDDANPLSWNHRPAATAEVITESPVVFPNPLETLNTQVTAASKNGKGKFFINRDVATSSGRTGRSLNGIDLRSAKPEILNPTDSRLGLGPTLPSPRSVGTVTL